LALARAFERTRLAAAGIALPVARAWLARARTVGTLDPARRPAKTAAQKAFYVVAYLNLTLVFVVIGLLAWWRWGL